MTSSTLTVTMLIVTLEPSPGTLNRLVFRGADGVEPWAMLEAGESGMNGFTVVNDGQYFFAHADEFGLGLHLA